MDGQLKSFKNLKQSLVFVRINGPIIYILAFNVSERCHTPDSSEQVEIQSDWTCNCIQLFEFFIFGGVFLKGGLVKKNIVEVILRRV